MEALKLTSVHGRKPEDQALQGEHAEQFYRLVLSGSATDIWVLAAHSEIPPDHWYGIKDNDQAAADTCHIRIREHCEDIRNAKNLGRDATFGERKVHTARAAQAHLSPPTGPRPWSLEALGACRRSIAKWSIIGRMNSLQ